MAATKNTSPKGNNFVHVVQNTGDLVAGVCGTWIHVVVVAGVRDFLQSKLFKGDCATAFIHFWGEG
jgi:hypothetical protein